MNEVGDSRVDNWLSPTKSISSCSILVPTVSIASEWDKLAPLEGNNRAAKDPTKARLLS